MLAKFLEYFLDILMTRGVIYDYVVMPHSNFRTDIGVQSNPSSCFQYIQINFKLKVNAIRHKSK